MGFVIFCLVIILALLVFAAVILAAAPWLTMVVEIYMDWAWPTAEKLREKVRKRK